jgi:hypothetical protein
MTTASKNIEPRGGARPVRMRQGRLRGRGRIDAQERVKRCSAKAGESGTFGSQTTRAGISEVIAQ